MSFVTIGRAPEQYPENKELYVPLTSFLPILEEYAEIWETKIVADWPDFEPEPQQHTLDHQVTIHFFHEYESILPQEHDASPYTDLTKIFDFPFHKPIAHIKLTDASYDVVTRIFHDFDGIPVCYMKGRSVYIAFDFLRSCWSDHSTILQLILTWIFAQDMSGCPPNESGKERFLQNLQRQHRETKVASAQDVIERQKKDVHLSVSEYQTKLTKEIQESALLETKYIDAIRAHRELEIFDREFELSVSKRDLGRDFDRIRRLEGVRNIRIHGKMVIIATHPLTQTYPPPGVTSKDIEVTEYDVGSVQFSIDTSCDITNGIGFQTIESGTHRNNYYNTTICFGTGVDGLNMTLSKLLALYKIPDVVAYILTFFRVVDAIPVKITEETTKAWSNALRPVDTLILNESEAQWERAREQYIALGVVKLAAIGQKERTEKLAQLQMLEFAAFHDLRNCWERTQTLRRLKDHIAFRRESIPAHVEQVLSMLEDNAVFLKLDCDGGIRIWFFEPFLFSYPALIWLRENRSTRVIAFSENYRQELHTVVVHPDSSPEIQDYQQLLLHAVTGMYNDVLNDVLRIVSRWRIAEIKQVTWE